jgi:hypothetical protein
MQKTSQSLIFLVLFGEIVLPGATRQVRAQAQSAPYPAAAPINQYLIPAKASEIDLARGAAPASISGAAAVLVLGPDGY